MYWSAFILGFLGSMHCVVMCGPIALTLKGQNNLNRFVLSRLLYNLGRVTTYALFGVVFGLMGRGIVLADYQQLLSIFLGSMMLFMAVAIYQHYQTNKINYYLSKVSRSIRTVFGRFIKSTSPLSSFLVGVTNGFLPCGLVYAALIGALASGQVIAGSTYMAVFGLGTFPAMLIVSLTGHFFSKKINANVHKLSSVFVFVLGTLLILRGMELSIPYLSPVIGFLYPLDAEITVCQ